MKLCECGHKKAVHNQKDGCMYQYAPGSHHDYQDTLGFCVCTEYYWVDLNCNCGKDVSQHDASQARACLHDFLVQS